MKERGTHNGEAIYYAKVYFKNNDEAVTSLPKVHAFLMQCVDASEWLSQNHVPENTKPVDLEGFAKSYPLASEFIRFMEGKKVGPYEVSERMLEDVGDRQEIDCIAFVDNYIRYCAYVWHFADWNPLLDFIVLKFGAQRACWLSDEYADLFDLL